MHCIILRDDILCAVGLDQELQHEPSSPPQTPFSGLRRLGGNLSEQRAINIRERFCSYFNTTGAVPWQLEIVRKGMTLENSNAENCLFTTM